MTVINCSGLILMQNKLFSFFFFFFPLYFPAPILSKHFGYVTEMFHNLLFVSFC